MCFRETVGVSFVRFCTFLCIRRSWCTCFQWKYANSKKQEWLSFTGKCSWTDLRHFLCMRSAQNPFRGFWRQVIGFRQIFSVLTVFICFCWCGQNGERRYPENCWIHFTVNIWVGASDILFLEVSGAYTVLIFRAMNRRLRLLWTCLAILFAQETAKWQLNDD